MLKCLDRRTLRRARKRRHRRCQAGRQSPYDPWPGLGDSGLRVFAPALVREDDVTAVAGDAECGIAVEPTAGAGNEGDLAHGPTLAA
ncbi:MAG: hypothetical protein H7Y22_12880 [Gemmatimonadaceae bacterium]|nr:hypothetical protein [Gloeobacterales cyanobacterium ES-bin-141]